MTYGVSNQEIISTFFKLYLTMSYIYAVIIYHILFIIVVLILLHLSYRVNVCHVFVGILSVYLSGTTMEISNFVFISYVYMYNVFTFYTK